jgi:hypothetical protein
MIIVNDPFTLDHVINTMSYKNIQNIILFIKT